MKNLKTIIAASALFLAAASAIRAEDPHAFPNPFVAQKSPSGTIAFTPLPDSGTIKIYTIDGLEIRSINIEHGGITNWDTKNSSGKSVASGVYYFRVNSGAEDNIGKLVVIR